jgi:hypothetical protein
LHVFIIAKAYALLPKMHNNMGNDLEELSMRPIEFFGLPDCLPLFSLYCRGNINNYRLYTYGNENSKKILFYLYNEAQKNEYEEEFSIENLEYKFSIHTPRCIYTTNTKTIRKIRKAINLSSEELKDFWKNHISYKFIKPKDVKKFDCLD